MRGRVGIRDFEVLNRPLRTPHLRLAVKKPAKATMVEKAASFEDAETGQTGQTGETGPTIHELKENFQDIVVVSLSY